MSAISLNDIPSFKRIELTTNEHGDLKNMKLEKQSSHPGWFVNGKKLDDSVVRAAMIEANL